MAENQILGESDFFLQLNGDVQKQWIFLWYNTSKY